MSQPLKINKHDPLDLISPFNMGNEKQALAGVAQWIERQTASQRVTGSIPSLRYMPGL